MNSGRIIGYGALGVAGVALAILGLSLSVAQNTAPNTTAQPWDINAAIVSDLQNRDINDLTDDAMHYGVDLQRIDEALALSVSDEMNAKKHLYSLTVAQ